MLNQFKISMDEKNIQNIHSIIKGCAERGVQVTEELASVFYKSFTLNPHVNTNLQQKLLRNKTVKIVDQCVNRLSVQKDPVILCIKMQLILDHDYKTKAFIVNKINENNEQKIKPLLNEILDNVNTTVNENSIYYHKILQYIILTNFLGDPSSQLCIQEISDALNIINYNKLLNFENQLQSSKRKQLKKITNLVCGIMLNNMNQKACKEDIFDVIDNLPNVVNLLIQNINQELESSSKKVTKITSWICQCYKVDNDILAPLFVIRTRFSNISNDTLNECKIILVYYLQYIKNLEKIKLDLEECKVELPLLLNKYNTTLEQINHFFENTNYFNEDIIFPKLINVSNIWNEIIEMTNYLSVSTHLITTMNQMTNEVINIHKYIGNSSVITFPNINEEQIIKSYPLHPMCKWHPSSTTNTFNEKNLFADGYCIVMIVETDGTLIKYNKNLGLIQYAEEMFGFTSIQAAFHFGTKPSYYLNCFYNVLRSQTHLLLFFNFYENMLEMQYISNEQMQKKYNKVRYKDAQVQTVLYPYNLGTTKININIKEIKKQCTSQENMPRMVTQSAQTLDVYKSVQIQTTSYDIGCNTMSEKGTNTN